MKLLSIIVPSYNSQDYLAQCIESLLPGGEDVEILIINDGSKDRTAEIAEEYQSKYPTIVRAIHQENKGHGGAVNTGIAQASGRYLKVVDSDDWLDAEAYPQVLETLKRLVAEEQGPDLFIANYIYDKQGKTNKRVIHYRGIIPTNRICTWDEVGTFTRGHYILMHSVIYRTDLIRASGMKLPEHTFYVDNLYVYLPLPYVKNLYYLDVNLYHYFIGRSDQSVQEKTMIKRIDQQLLVNRLMLNEVSLESINNPKLFWYMIHYFEIVTAITSIMLVLSGTGEHEEKRKALWADIERHNPLLHWYLRRGIVGRAFHLPRWFGRPLLIALYRIAQGLFGFN
ncbi:MAG: glycosyltransferase family 2 protein [Spirochaetota bacterium]|jgi:glycosyltransferase involved in cell wall biosynthesis